MAAQASERQPVNPKALTSPSIHGLLGWPTWSRELGTADPGQGPSVTQLHVHGRWRWSWGHQAACTQAGSGARVERRVKKTHQPWPWRHAPGTPVTQEAEAHQSPPRGRPGHWAGAKLASDQGPGAARRAGRGLGCSSLPASMGEAQPGRPRRPSAQHLQETAAPLQPLQLHKRPWSLQSLSVGAPARGCLPAAPGQPRSGWSRSQNALGPCSADLGRDPCPHQGRAEHPDQQAQRTRQQELGPSGEVGKDTNAPLMPPCLVALTVPRVSSQQK